MKIVFMGTPEFAVPSFEALIVEHTVLAAVCQPDKPNSRGRKVIFGAVKQVALENGIDVLQPENVNDKDFVKSLYNLEADVIAVAAYGQILCKDILDIPKFGCVNVHGSLLPKYRGAAPIQWAIINGEEQTGITIMRMSQGLDAGDMIFKSHITIELSDTYGTLLKKLAVLGAKDLITALALLSDGTAKTIMQNDAEATYAPLINKEIGRIDWSNTGKDIVNLIRGLNPAPGAYSILNDVKLKIWSVEVFSKSCEESDCGQVLDVLRNKGIIVNAKNGCVIIKELQKDGGKKMSAVDFARGHNIEKGMIFK